MSISSDPVYAKVDVISYPDRTYAKFTLQQKATTLAILHAPSATLPTDLVVDSYSYRTRATYAASA